MLAVSLNGKFAEARALNWNGCSSETATATVPVTSVTLTVLEICWRIAAALVVSEKLLNPMAQASRSDGSGGTVVAKRV